jgi:hypothetical protein
VGVGTTSTAEFFRDLALKFLRRRMINGDLQSSPPAGVYKKGVVPGMRMRVVERGRGCGERADPGPDSGGGHRQLPEPGTKKANYRVIMQIDYAGY